MLLALFEAYSLLFAPRNHEVNEDIRAEPQAQVQA